MGRCRIGRGGVAHNPVLWLHRFLRGDYCASAGVGILRDYSARPPGAPKEREMKLGHRFAATGVAALLLLSVAAPAVMGYAGQVVNQITVAGPAGTLSLIH